MKKIIYLLSTILTFLLINCHKSDSDSLTNNDIIGEWNWIETDGGVVFNIHNTPKSTGMEITVILNNDYSYSVIENDKSISNGTYNLSHKNSIHNNKTRFIQISDTNFASPLVLNGSIIIEENGALNISDNNYDGIGSRFEKVN